MTGPDNSSRATKRSRAGDETPMKNMPLNEGRAKRRRSSHGKTDTDSAFVSGKRQKSGEADTGVLPRSNNASLGGVKKPMTPPESWTLSNTIAGQFRDIDPVLTSDEQYLFVAFEAAIHVYSVTTSRLFRTLQLKPGHQIVGYALSPGNQEHLFIFTSTGSVTKWDWLSCEQTSCLGSRSKTISVDLSTYSVDNHIGFNLISLRKHKDEKKEIVVTTLSDQNPSEVSIIQTSARISHIKVVRNGQVVVAYGSQHVLLGVASSEPTSSIPSYSWHEVKVPVNITCLDLRCSSMPSRAEEHPSGKSRAGQVDLVLGEANGSILLYHDIISSFENHSEVSRNPAPRRLHWHRGSVNAVRWSRDGNYIISGGHESVMVLWQLETGRKHFLPHLSSPICNITVSSSGNTYVVKLADNCIMVLSARELQPFATIIGLQLCPKVAGLQDRSMSSAYCQPQLTTAALHPQHPDRILLAVPASRQLTQCGRPLSNSSVLQTYDINANSHLSRQALARTNATTLSISPEGSQIIAPDVTHLSISHDGKWMATVDDWCPYPQDVEALELSQKQATHVTLRETFLKFWKWNGISAVWELATRVDGPHFSRDGPLPVLDLAARPRSYEFATIGLDMVLRFWCPSIRNRSGLKAANDTESLETWKCRSTIDLSGYFMNYAPGQSSAAFISFSQDGSVLAVCAQSDDPLSTGLTILIDAQSCNVRYSRTGLYTGKPCAAEFLGCHLAIASQQSLSIWNIVDDTVRVVNLAANGSSVTVSPLLLAVNPTTETFAVASQDVQGNHPVKKTRQPHFRVRVYDIRSLSLIFQSPLSHCPLALLGNPNSADYIVVDSAANIQRLGSTKKVSHSNQPPNTAIHLQSGLASLFGSQPRGTSIQPSNGLDSSRSNPSNPHSKDLAGVFGDVPPFVLPPANKLFQDVVHALSG
ncbi:WD domain protein [Aspergillus steynii IBT 23096]|uniref:WD domain protein n=1 Tax=Aspergillus steynii IBT 23096 TaxID=1392250 RepID=A0A2I2G9M6_9EURO|nr:WD domain protein [Aspergillus steynii IBT 23096]PLB49553.1 WD domain protein [Aspergillus steynii IBT 23096]